MIGGIGTTDLAGVLDISIPATVFDGLEPIITATIDGTIPHFITVSNITSTTFRVNTFNVGGIPETASFKWQAISP
jgi:hypothetical protein